MERCLIDYLRSTLRLWDAGCFRLTHVDGDAILTVSKDFFPEEIKTAVGLFYNTWFDL